MCHGALASNRGIKFPRITEREERLKSITPQRDEKEVARKEEILIKKANRPEKIAKRVRRSKAKKVKAGMKNLRQQGLIH